MLEKPIALELWEADELIQLAKRNNLKFTIGYSQRFNPKIAYAKKKITDGTLGKVVSVLVSRHLSRSLGKKIASRVRLSPVVMESTHDLDFVFWLLEPAKPVRVYSQGAYGYMQPVNGSHDVMFTTVTMDNGVRGDDRRRLELAAELSELLRHLDRDHRHRGRAVPRRHPARQLAQHREGAARNSRCRPCRANRSTMCSPAAWGRRRSISSKPASATRPVMVTPESARRVMETYSAADLSADRNEPVDLPLTNETISAIAEFKQKIRAGLNTMKKSAKGVGLAIIGGGRVGLFRGEVAARHPAVEWIGLAEKNPNRAGEVGAEDQRRFRHAEPRRIAQAAGSDRRDHLHRRASARRSDHGGGRARHSDADREAAGDRSRRIRARAQGDQGRQARRRGRLYPALPPPLAGRQGESAAPARSAT